MPADMSPALGLLLLTLVSQSSGPALSPPPDPPSIDLEEAPPLEAGAAASPPVARPPDDVHLQTPEAKPAPAAPESERDRAARLAADRLEPAEAQPAPIAPAPEPVPERAGRLANDRLEPPGLLEADLKTVPPAPAHESVRERAVRLAKVPQYPRLQRVEAWLPAGLGVLAVCGSAYLLVNAGFVHQTFEREGLMDLDEIAAVAEQGQRLQTWGWVGMGTAAALFGVAAFGVLHPDPAPGPTTRLSISLSARGAGLSWAGSF